MIGDELLDHSRNPYPVTRQFVDDIILDVLFEVDRAQNSVKEAYIDLHLPGSDVGQRDRIAALDRLLRQAQTDLRAFGVTDRRTFGLTEP